jgi:hypothetical protein
MIIHGITLIQVHVSFHYTHNALTQLYFGMSDIIVLRFCTLELLYKVEVWRNKYKNEIHDFTSLEIFEFHFVSKPQNY